MEEWKKGVMEKCEMEYWNNCLDPLNGLNF
jgi:hypothetical protein